MNFSLVKNKKGTVILLSLFLIFFTVSIIGIIYSYNKRIFQLAKQEKQNYQIFKKKFDEVFTNLYIFDLNKIGWNSTLFDLTTINKATHSENINEEVIYTYTSNNNSPDFIKPDIFFLDDGNLKIIINGVYRQINTPVSFLRQKRMNFFNSLNIKNEIEGKLKKILGDDIEIIAYTLEKDPQQIDNKTKSVTITYKATVEKPLTIILENKKKIKTGKKFEVEIQYEISYPIHAEASIPAKDTTVRWLGPQNDIYEHKYKEQVTGKVESHIEVKLKNASITYKKQ